MINKKFPVRIILTAWGEPYIKQLMSFSLPALLAPGNLPVLAEAFDCELFLVTQKKLFPMIRKSGVFKAVEKYCKTKLISNDDILAPGQYGAVLTYSLWRGFEDLGDKVSDYYLVFINSDFILADGSYRKMVKHMLAGERLIHSPSYCTIEEKVIPGLKKFINKETHVLSVPPRKMAAMILNNLHLAPRAKIVNQKTWCIDRVDQFYWHVDKRTLLGRQMPVAIVCMRPKRFRPKPVSFWDYSTVSELCPNTEPCVIGDSDEFLMLEFRTENTYMEQSHLGWHTTDEIAEDLDSFSTRDQLHYGRYPLILHSGDIPDTVPEAENMLDGYLKEIYAKLSPEPVPYKNHKYWRHQSTQIERFLADLPMLSIMPEELAAQEQQAREVAHRLENLTRIDRLRERLSNLPGRVRRAIVSRIKNFLRNFGGSLYYRTMGKVPYLKMFHPFWGCYHIAINLIETGLTELNPENILIIHAEDESLLSPILHRKAMSCSNSRFSDLYQETSSFLNIQKSKEYDFCICELNYSDLVNFRKTYEKVIRPMMRPGARVIVHYPNVPHLNFPDRNYLMATEAFPHLDTSITHYAGTNDFWNMDRLMENATKLLEEARSNFWLAILGILQLLQVMGFARLINRKISRHIPHNYPNACTSITTVIDVLPNFKPPARNSTGAKRIARIKKNSPNDVTRAGSNTFE